MKRWPTEPVHPRTPTKSSAVSEARPCFAAGGGRETAVGPDCGVGEGGLRTALLCRECAGHCRTWGMVLVTKGGNW